MINGVVYMKRTILIPLEKFSKYGNKKTIVDGITFDSKKESERYLVLKDMLKNKEITELQLQPKFLLQDSFKYKNKIERNIYYIADFSYKKDGKLIVEDVKGKKTDVYKLKRKLFLYKYIDIDFREV